LLLATSPRSASAFAADPKPGTRRRHLAFLLEHQTVHRDAARVQPAIHLGVVDRIVELVRRLLQPIGDGVHADPPAGTSAGFLLQRPAKIERRRLEGGAACHAQKDAAQMCGESGECMHSNAGPSVTAAGQA